VCANPVAELQQDKGVAWVTSPASGNQGAFRFVQGNPIHL